MSSLTLLGSGAAFLSSSGSATASRVAERYAAGTAALLRGDGAGWSRLVPLAPDFLLMSPMGGEPSRGVDYTPERVARMARFFRNGELSQQVLASWSNADLIVLATIERGPVEVGGLPRQDWPLRVTSVFVREGRKWKLAHRHADPLVEAIAVEQAARLAAGGGMGRAAA